VVFEINGEVLLFALSGEIVMAKGRFAIGLGTLVLALGFGSQSPRAADTDECRDTPNGAVTILPAPLRKWGAISCTPYGQVIGGRDGWMWASLDDAKGVLIPSQMVEGHPRPVGDNSYFVNIKVRQLEDDDLAAAVSTFEKDLDIGEASAKAYRVELMSVSGDMVTFDFFDFGTFGGGMYCSDGDGCAPSSRFLIMNEKTDDGSI
jgi:hypothetical protein